MNLSPKLQCPSCRGSRLVAGNPHSEWPRFVPAGKIMLLGFAALRFACLDCGFIGDCLGEETCSKVEQKVSGST